MSTDKVSAQRKYSNGCLEQIVQNAARGVAWNLPYLFLPGRA
jgi:hypothetical protein